MDQPRRSAWRCAAAVMGLAAAALAGTATPAAAQIASRIEILAVPTRTLTGPEVFRAEPSAGREVTVAGELRLPPRAPPRSPAVILIHGSGGISGSLDLWARELNAVGVAAFILDSFAGRGIVSTVADQDQLNSFAMAVDAYKALDILAAHPRVRPDRIAVMGFSKGAVPAIYSATDRFATAYGAKGNRFAAHIGLYTPCNVAFDGDAKVGPAPIRMFHGITDDYVPIAPCRDYVGRLKAGGADVSLTEYPDSPHGFDSPLAPRLLAVPNAQSTRDCKLAIGPDGAVLNAQTGQPYAIKSDPCVAVGAHVGHNPETTAMVRVAVREFLQQALVP